MFKNKKGFTIVELVIVIAVIAILAAVLIPTFSSVIENAKKSSAVQEAKAAIDIVAMEENLDTSIKMSDYEYYIVGENYVYKYTTAGTLESNEPEAELDATTTQVAYINALSNVKAFFVNTALPTGVTAVEGAETIVNSDISAKVVVVRVKPAA